MLGKKLEGDLGGVEWIKSGLSVPSGPELVTAWQGKDY